MELRGYSKTDLAERAEISLSFISDLTHGKANPSLATMEAIAAALEVPLPPLLESNPVLLLPAGYERVTAVLPAHRAFQVKKWAEETRDKLALGFRKRLER